MLKPVFVEWRINYTMMTGRVIEPVFIRYDSNVREIPEKHQVAKSILFAGCGSAETGPQSSSAAAFEIDPRRTEGAPNKTRTVIGRGSGSSPNIASAQPLLYRCGNQPFKWKIRFVFANQRPGCLDILSRRE